MSDHANFRTMLADAFMRVFRATLSRITLDAIVAASCIIVAAFRFPLWLHLLDGSPIDGAARTLILNWTAWLIAGGLAFIQLLLMAYISRHGWDDDFLISAGWVAIAFGFPVFVSLESVMHAKELTNLNAAEWGWIRTNSLHLLMAYCSNVSPELGASLVIRKHVLEEKKRELERIESVQLERAEGALLGYGPPTVGSTVEPAPGCITEEDVRNRAPCKLCGVFVPAVDRDYRQSMLRHVGHCKENMKFKAVRETADPQLTLHIEPPEGGDHVCAFLSASPDGTTTPGRSP